MDEVMINANQLENSGQSTAAALWKSSLPFAVDPVLWRFQLPKWRLNKDGKTKRNYTRLAAAYGRGVGAKLDAGPLLDVVSSDNDWRAIAANVIDYQRVRLLSEPTQLDLLDPDPPRELRPVRLTAASLVANSRDEDRINSLLLEASCLKAGKPVAAQLIVPVERLLDDDQRRHLANSIPTDGVSACFIWIPQLSEEQLLSDPVTLTSLVALVSDLAHRGIPVGHQYGNYTIAALHDFGLSALAHHMGWVDRGEPAEEQKFMMRSCRTYVPGLRHCVTFREAERVGRDLTREEFVSHYCECTLCVGAFDNGQHPLDMLLEDQMIVMANGRKRATPTGRAVGANAWHFLLARRLEIQAFSNDSAASVIRGDIDRAASLGSAADGDRLQRLANELRTA